MENNNWRVAQAQSQGQTQIAGQVMGGDAAASQELEAGDWRTQLQPDSRQRIVNKIMDTLKRHLPFSGQEGLQELKKIAVRFEEKIYTAATSQSDYLRKISLKMLTMETKSQNPMANSLQANSASNSKNPQDPASQGMQSQMQNQAQAIPIALTSNQAQPQVRHPLLSQNIPNNMASTGSLNSASLTSGIAPCGMSQGTMPNVVGQSPNMQDMSNAVNPNTVGNTMGPSNVFANSQRQIPTGVRQQQIVQQQEQQQQQQSQNPQLYLYNPQVQQHLMKQKLQQGGIPQSLLQSQIQQQQQNLLQPNQLQPSLRQSAAPSSTLQQNQQSSLQQSTQSMLQQQSQSVLRQQQQQQPQQQQQQLSMMHQQQNSMPQHQQPNTASMQQSQLIGQHNTILDAQQQQRLMAQQNNNISNLQQQQTGNVQNNLPNMHQQQSNSQQNLQQQQFGLQNNLSGFQHQQMVGVQHGNSGMQTNQQPVMLPQSKVSAQQQMQQSMTNMLPNQPQQSQSQPPQHQMMSQNQSQPGQIQQQLGLQQRMQTPGSLLQQQNAIDQQRQLLQSQRMMPEVPLNSSSHTGNTNGGDRQEEIYQKIKSMNEKYFPDLNEMHQRMAAKLQQHDPPPQQPKNEQLEKLRFFVVMLEKLIMFLRTNKNEIQPNYKEKSVGVEKQIVNILNSHRPRKPVSSLQQQQGQAAPQSHMHFMQQSQQQQPQIPQMHENQINSQMQPMNIQGATSTQQNNLTNLQHNSNVVNSRQNMMDPSIDHGQGNPMNSIQQVSMNSMQQNLGTGPQQMNMNSMSSSQAMQSNVNALQTNTNIHVKQEQQMFSTQQLKQQPYQQQRQLQQQQYIHRQQLMQQQSGGQLASPQQMVQQINQMNETNDIKMRQQIKSGVLQQQHSNSGQRASYHHQQMKTGTPISSISSPQLLQVVSPQIGHHPSPQFDQQNMLNSHTKAETPLQQSVNSPFVVPSPSISMVPSPMPVGDSEKFNPSLSNAGNNNVQHHPNTGGSMQAPSLAIGTPGISASPLLAEFTSPDGTTHGVASTIVSGNSNAVEHPLDRLIKAVKSMSPKALSASISDISSVVSMVDRIAGSAPGNGSRAAVGEDLVAMTKCRLQARNFFYQDGPSGTKKMRRYTSAMPSNVVSSTGSVNDGLKHLNGCESDGESTGASSIRKPKLGTNHALEEELREINQQLIDTVVFISEDDADPTAVTTATEGGEGTIVKCSYNAISLSPSLKSQYASAQMSPIQPLRLLVPSNYPNCSPILLDKFPIEVSKEYEDLNIKAKSRFSISLRTLTQPMSLGEIARTWDMCAHAVISDYAQQSGGGTFSSKYGTWENCLSAA